MQQNHNQSAANYSSNNKQSHRRKESRWKQPNQDMVKVNIELLPETETVRFWQRRLGKLMAWRIRR
ncbi:hypothetical protein TSUD_171830 [Trifolium subterraneum]|uniref:Uncharacterized protein n=1 Tax=Trifolium subterraneum TaxID=3900 RepID=A0A2Z6M741_TRISU|nr:hypothetical protein TSUD_171830 [Trifolium subterraneum]